MKADEIEELDISDRIGSLYPQDAVEWPMYSYNKPAYLFWNGFARGLARRGFTLKQIKSELQSKGVRLMLDACDEKLIDCGEDLAMDYRPCVSKPKREHS